MLIVMKSGSTPEDLERLQHKIRSMGLETFRPAPGGRRLGVRIPDGAVPDVAALESLAEVALVMPVSRSVPRVDRGDHPEDTRLRIGPAEIGGGALTLIAGPCAVEDEDQLVSLACELRRAGADLLRGGAYKPRSSPYDFQGLGERALRALARARDEAGLPIVTEAVDEASLERVERYADVIQIGARNMHNFALLKRVGRSRLPVFLKRGFAASLEDLLLAAEYVLDQGNPRVMLCERGIRTFSDHSRFTLDLSIVPLIKKCSHLPIFVDPSHACGIRDSVAPLACAAVAAGADGVMVEVHPEPARAFCDGPQSLLPDEFERLAARLRAIRPLLDGQREPVP